MTSLFDIFKKKGSFVVLLAGVSLVVAAGTLLARFVFNSAPPDVSKAEISEIAEFTKSEDFLKIRQLKLANCVGLSKSEPMKSDARHA